MWIINLTGLLLVALIVWWFWLYQSNEVEADDQTLTIIVDNGVYQPSRIKVHTNQPITLLFVRKDASPCAETLLFPELEVSETLPLNQTYPIRLPALKAGVYAFHCQMQMYRGELHVE